MSNTLRKKYFLEIDEIPLRNYRKALEDHSYEYLRRDVDEGNEVDDNTAWLAVSDDYIKVFGLGEKYEEYLDLQIQLIELNCDFVINSDRFLLNQIEMVQHDMSKIMSGDGSGKLDDAITFVMRVMKTVIDENKITAKAFFKLLDSCVKEQKQRNGKESNQGE